mgnify:CR=1 FL=1
MTMDSILMLLLTLFGLIVLFRVNRMIAKVQRKQLEEEIVREVVRKSLQKRKIDELYGRSRHEE